MSVWFIILELMYVELELLQKALAGVNILANATFAWLMNDVLVVWALEEHSTNDRVFFFNTYFFRDLTGKSLNWVEF